MLEIRDGEGKLFRCLGVAGGYAINQSLGTTKKNWKYELQEWKTIIPKLYLKTRSLYHP